MVLEKYLEVRTRNSEFASPTRRPDKQVIAVLYLQPASLGHTVHLVLLLAGRLIGKKVAFLHLIINQILKSLFGVEGIQKSITRIS